MKKLIAPIVILGIIVIAFVIRQPSEPSDFLQPITLDSVVYGLPGSPPAIQFTEIDTEDESLGGVSFRPSEFKTSLAESKSEGHSDTTLTVNSITTKDGNTLDPGILGDTIVLHISPGKTNAEIVTCTGLTTGSLQFTGCTFGFRFDQNATQASNILAHSPGETVIISNDDHYLNAQYGALDSAVTVTGQWNFSTSTKNVVRLEFGTSTNTYIWHDKSTGQFGFATSSSGELVWNTSGTTFNPLAPMVLASGVLSVATSSASGLTLNGSALEIDDGYGLALGGDGKLNIATSSSVDWNFGGFATTSKNLVIGTTNPIGDFGVGDLWVGGNATTSASLHVAEICDLNNYCRTNLRQLASSTTDAITISNSADVTGIMNTTTITGGLLGTSNVIRVRINLANSRTTGSVNTTIILRYGNQELAILRDGGNFGTIFGSIEAIIMADGATNAQQAFLKVDLPQASLASGGLVSYATTTVAGTVDSTVDQDLTITWQWATADANNRVVASSTFKYLYRN